MIFKNRAKIIKNNFRQKTLIMTSQINKYQYRAIKKNIEEVFLFNINSVLIIIEEIIK